MAKVKYKRGNGRTYTNISQYTKTFLKDFNANLRSNIARAPKEDIENEIIITILSGQSPVKGKRFKQYNKEYADRFKNGERSPVNMLRTGKMLESLQIKQIRGKNGLLIAFRNRLSVIHDKLGAGKSKVIRRLIPRTGEEFKSSITKLIKKLFVNNVRKSTR